MGLAGIDDPEACIVGLDSRAPGCAGRPSRYPSERHRNALAAIRRGSARGGQTRPWAFFTAEEGAAVEALVDRLIPPDAETPGGKDCGCAVFIDRQLAGDYGSRMHTMLSRDRADYTIGFDATLREEPGQAELLTSESIAGASAPVLAGVACPRTSWGLAVIRRVEQIYNTPEAVALLRRESESWLTPELRKRYAAQIDEFYRSKTKATPTR